MTLASAQYAAGVRIAGIGPADNKNRATVWATRGAARVISALGLSATMDWRADCLVTLPDTVERRVDPWASRYETSPMSFELDAASVGDVIPVQAWQPVANLTSALATGIGTVRLNTDALGGQVVYVGDETLALGVGPSSLGGGVWEYTVTRAYNESDQQEHPAGEPVFASPPAWIGRRVELVQLRSSDTGQQPRVMWSGFLQDIRTAELGTRIVLECREIFDGLVDRQIGRGMRDLNEAGSITLNAYTQGSLAGVIDFESQIVKPWTATRKVCVQIDDSLWVVTQATPGVLDMEQAVRVAGQLDNVRDELPDEALLGQYVPLARPVREVFVVSRELDELYGDVSVTRDLGALKYHPVAIAFALLTSTARATALFDPLEYDVFAAGWGCDVWGWLDVEGWADMIAATPELAVDQLYPTWDGEPVAVIEALVEKLLRPYGFFLAITERGKLSIKRLISPTIRDLCEAATRQVPLIRPASGGQFGWRYEIGSAVGEVTALVGGTPWAEEPSTVTVRLYGRAPRGAQLADPRIYTYDLSTRTRRLVASFGDGDAGDALALELIDKAIRASWALPRIELTAPDSKSVLSTLSYDLGAFVTLAGPLPPAPIWRLPTGELVDPTEEATSAHFLGQIMAARLNIPTQTWELELLLVAWRTGSVARYRAPSALIESWDDGLLELEVYADSYFGGEDTDAAGFAVGDEVVFVEVDGEDSGEAVRTVTAVSDRYVTLDDATAGNPSGLVMRLANSDVYSNTGSAADVTCSDRPWVYLADTADEIDRPDSEVEPADTYG